MKSVIPWVGAACVLASAVVVPASPTYAASPSVSLNSIIGMQSSEQESDLTESYGATLSVSNGFAGANTLELSANGWPMVENGHAVSCTVWGSSGSCTVSWSGLSGGYNDSYLELPGSDGATLTDNGYDFSGYNIGNAYIPIEGPQWDGLVSNPVQPVMGQTVTLSATANASVSAFAAQGGTNYLVITGPPVNGMYPLLNSEAFSEYGTIAVGEQTLLSTTAKATTTPETYYAGVVAGADGNYGGRIEYGLLPLCAPSAYNGDCTVFNPSESTTVQGTPPPLTLSPGTRYLASGQTAAVTATLGDGFAGDIAIINNSTGAIVAQGYGSSYLYTPPPQSPGSLMTFSAMASIDGEWDYATNAAVLYWAPPPSAVVPPLIVVVPQTEKAANGQTVPVTVYWTPPLAPGKSVTLTNATTEQVLTTCNVQGSTSCTVPLTGNNTSVTIVASDSDSGTESVPVTIQWVSTTKVTTATGNACVPPTFEGCMPNPLETTYQGQTIQPPTNDQWVTEGGATPNTLLPGPGWAIDGTPVMQTTTTCKGQGTNQTCATSQTQTGTIYQEVYDPQQCPYPVVTTG